MAEGTNVFDWIYSASVHVMAFLALLILFSLTILNDTSQYRNILIYSFTFLGCAILAYISRKRRKFGKLILLIGAWGVGFGLEPGEKNFPTGSGRGSKKEWAIVLLLLLVVIMFLFFTGFFNHFIGPET